MTPALLDVNVLLALAWPNHQYHAEAHRWFSRQARGGWATIAATQLAFIRLSSNPAYTPDAVSPRDAATLLSRWLTHPGHHFWPSPAAAAVEVYRNALGYHQVNDAYLVEAARRAKGRLVTFDHRLKAHDPAGKVVCLIVEPLSR
ncbi:MAG: PIN domain-containing protein [Verrucomicrobia bacterium]|nr:PIN domain-containing protein [Verrucomicrobiota bacterium]